MTVQLFPFTNLKLVFFNIQKIKSDKNKSKGLAKRTNLSNERFEKVVRPKPLEMETYIAFSDIIVLNMKHSIF